MKKRKPEISYVSFEHDHATHEFTIVGYGTEKAIERMKKKIKATTKQLCTTDLYPTTESLEKALKIKVR